MINQLFITHYFIKNKYALVSDIEDINIDILLNLLYKKLEINCKIFEVIIKNIKRNTKKYRLL